MMLHKFSKFLVACTVILILAGSLDPDNVSVARAARSARIGLQWRYWSLTNSSAWPMRDND